MPGPPEEMGLTNGCQEQRGQTGSTGPPEEMGSSEDRSLTMAGPPEEMGLTNGFQEKSLVPLLSLFGVLLLLPWPLRQQD